ncbi:hypothetical protein [Adhaeribacter aquaticus]|uniref:hypothetical protein n=1 Tax=Adhaeribacter aquaticus TaxID=299567 RepID=UPI000428E09C|nr:hypothetical protein [Adhaeribacter aquaticus]
MNKLLVLLAVVLLGAGAVSAQNKPAKQAGAPTGMPSLAESADQQTKAMAKQLNLTADQTTRIKALQLQQLNEMKSLRSKAGDDREAMIQGSQAIREKYNAEYKTVLTPDQFAKFQGGTAQAKNKRGLERAN